MGLNLTLHPSPWPLVCWVISESKLRPLFNDVSTYYLTSLVALAWSPLVGMTIFGYRSMLGKYVIYLDIPFGYVLMCNVCYKFLLFRLWLEQDSCNHDNDLPLCDLYVTVDTIITIPWYVSTYYLTLLVAFAWISLVGMTIFGYRSMLGKYVIYLDIPFGYVLMCNVCYKFLLFRLWLEQDSCNHDNDLPLCDLYVTVDTIITILWYV